MFLLIVFEFQDDTSFGGKNISTYFSYPAELGLLKYSCAVREKEAGTQTLVNGLLDTDFLLLGLFSNS